MHTNVHTHKQPGKSDRNGSSQRSWIFDARVCFSLLTWKKQQRIGSLGPTPGEVARGMLYDSSLYLLNRSRECGNFLIHIRSHSDSLGHDKDSHDLWVCVSSFPLCVNGVSLCVCTNVMGRWRKQVSRGEIRSSGLSCQRTWQRQDFFEAHDERHEKLDPRTKRREERCGGKGEKQIQGPRVMEPEKPDLYEPSLCRIFSHALSPNPRKFHGAHRAPPLLRHRQPHYKTAWQVTIQHRTSQSTEEQASGFSSPKRPIPAGPDGLSHFFSFTISSSDLPNGLEGRSPPRRTYLRQCWTNRRCSKLFCRRWPTQRGTHEKFHAHH